MASVKSFKRVYCGTCDRETVGRDDIRQSVNSFISFGLVLAGALVFFRASLLPLQLFGAVLSAAGAASFLSHAAVRDWSHTLDSLGVKAVVLFLIIYPLTRPRPMWAAYTLALVLIWALELAWPATARPLLVALVATAVIVNLGRAMPRASLRLAVTTLLLATVAWWLGRSASVLCYPDSVFQPHALWHLLVAGGLAALYLTYRESEQR